jgi:Fe2+ or Zn2+ uptake regulation protein
MFGLIYNWFEKQACKHKWKLHNEAKLYDESSLQHDMPCGIHQILICEQCGKIKMLKIKA